MTAMTNPASSLEMEEDIMLESNIKAFIAAARYYLLGLLPPPAPQQLASIPTRRQA
jgi:hypothetical protein